MASAASYTYVNVGCSGNPNGYEFFPCDSARPGTITATGKGCFWALPATSVDYPAPTPPGWGLLGANDLRAGAATRMTPGQTKVCTTPVFIQGDFTFSQIPAGS